MGLFVNCIHGRGFACGICATEQVTAAVQANTAAVKAAAEASAARDVEARAHAAELAETAVRAQAAAREAEDNLAERRALFARAEAEEQARAAAGQVPELQRDQFSRPDAAACLVMAERRYHASGGWPIARQVLLDFDALRAEDSEQFVGVAGGQVLLDGEPQPTAVIVVSTHGLTLCIGTGADPVWIPWAGLDSGLHRTRMDGAWSGWVYSMPVAQRLLMLLIDDTDGVGNAAMTAAVDFCVLGGPVTRGDVADRIINNFRRDFPGLLKFAMPHFDAFQRALGDAPVDNVVSWSLPTDRGKRYHVSGWSPQRLASVSFIPLSGEADLRCVDLANVASKSLRTNDENAFDGILEFCTHEEMAKPARQRTYQSVEITPGFADKDVPPIKAAIQALEPRRSWFRR